MMFLKINNHFLILFTFPLNICMPEVESLNNVSSVSLMSDSLTSAPVVPDLMTIFFYQL